MQSAFTSIAPLTLTLSPEGRGDAGDSAGEGANISSAAGPLLPRASGEKVRARGKKALTAQVKRARTLRRDMTDAENRLWYHLRDRRLLGFKFVRQYPIARYFADFACREAMLIIEADGGQYAPERDAFCDLAIKAAGYTILRFWNNDILGNTTAVLEEITNTLASCVPSPLRGEGQGEGSIPHIQTTSTSHDLSR